MGPNGLNCKERRELEQLIHDCIKSIAHSSRSAAKLAQREPLGGHLEFEMARADYNAETIRLETLRECLALHARLHGCHDGLITVEATQASNDS